MCSRRRMPSNEGEARGSEGQATGRQLVVRSPESDVELLWGLTCIPVHTRNGPVRTVLSRISLPSAVIVLFDKHYAVMKMQAAAGRELQVDKRNFTGRVQVRRIDHPPLYC